jgi:hypothetical protein
MALTVLSLRLAIIVKPPEIFIFTARNAFFYAVDSGKQLEIA